MCLQQGAIWMRGEDVQGGRLGLSYALLYAMRHLGLQAKACLKVAWYPKTSSESPGNFCTSSKLHFLFP